MDNEEPQSKHYEAQLVRTLRRMLAYIELEVLAVVAVDSTMVRRKPKRNDWS